MLSSTNQRKRRIFTQHTFELSMAADLLHLALLLTASPLHLLVRLVLLRPVNSHSNRIFRRTSCRAPQTPFSSHQSSQGSRCRVMPGRSCSLSTGCVLEVSSGFLTRRLTRQGKTTAGGLLLSSAGMNCKWFRATAR